jgi:membrane protease YdiL (CAAX protease family)
MAFALLFPAALTWVYFVSLADSPPGFQQLAYSIGKAIQFVLPVGWVGLILRERLRWPVFTTRGLALGISFGLVVVGAMAWIYLIWLRPSGEFDAVAHTMSEKLRKIGVSGPAAFAVMAVFYSLVHSLLEEYYWRWFVFGRLRNLLPLGWAIAVSCIGFMAHHVIVLGIYFGWANGWTYFFSLSTAVGGAFWAWLYHRSGSIYGPWISHALLDAGIFGIGYSLICSTAAVP